MLSLGMGSAVAGNSFPGSSVAKLSSLPPDGCQAHAKPRALHYVQQDTATHSPTVCGHKVKPPVCGTGGLSRQFPTRTGPETSLNGKDRKQLGHVGR